MHNDIVLIISPHGFWVIIGIVIVISALLIWGHQLNKALKKSVRLAETDPLTGLYNRRTSEKRLAEEIDRATRHKHGLQILFVDLDDFQGVNNRHGHKKGDEVLKEVAHHLKQIVRRYDILSRHGGDEFLLILPETSVELAEVTAKRVIAAIENINIGDGSVKISASIGIKPFNPEYPADDLIAAADEAMYIIKKDGKKGIHVLN